MIDLQLSNEQEDIVRSVSAFLAHELPLDRLRSKTGSLLGEDQRLWKQIGDLGYFGLGLEEKWGGTGYGLVEEALVFREFGRSLLSPSALAMALGARTAALSGAAKLTGAVLAGEVSIGLAVPFDYASQQPPLAGAYHLIDDLQADFLMMWNEGGAALIPRDRFEALEKIQCIDWTVALTRAQLRDYTPECWVNPLHDDIPGRATLLIAAMLTGTAEGALSDSVEYVKVRQQFGQPLGAFQAVKHRCADMATRASAAWSLTLFAALTKQQVDAHPMFQITAAKIVATDAAVRNAAADIQNLGGMGFTGEHNPHLFLKRAHLLDRIGGNLAWHRTQFMTMSSPL